MDYKKIFIDQVKTLVAAQHEGVSASDVSVEAFKNKARAIVKTQYRGEYHAILFKSVDQTGVVEGQVKGFILLLDDNNRHVATATPTAVDGWIVEDDIDGI